MNPTGKEKEIQPTKLNGAFKGKKQKGKKYTIFCR